MAQTMHIAYIFMRKECCYVHFNCNMIIMVSKIHTEVLYY